MYRGGERERERQKKQKNKRECVENVEGKNV
jgi:hypothetical protein